jgi:hypothetical protein
MEKRSSQIIFLSIFSQNFSSLTISNFINEFIEENMDYFLMLYLLVDQNLHQSCNSNVLTNLST